MFQTQFVHQVREEEEPGFESQPPRSGSRPTESLDSASVPGKREASRRHHDQAALQVRFRLALSTQTSELLPFVMGRNDKSPNTKSPNLKKFLNKKTLIKPRGVLPGPYFVGLLHQDFFRGVFQRPCRVKTYSDEELLF